MSEPGADHRRKLEAMYRAAPCNAAYGPDIRVDEGRAEINFPVRPEFLHAGGGVHGSIYFKAMDDAAYFAAASLVDDVFLLTANFHLHFLRPVAAGRLRAVGSVVERTRSQILADALLYDDRDKLLARGGGAFMRSGTKLSPDIGYG